ncbi:tyrosine-type recombinase/integrase [Propionibacterium freudenreichii]|uniref:tyrosine-type recombinase/integrase n=1 Tax=Propionibacterium freudenreichii TaxID=1744 RepID=UPI00254A87F1|nr:site-specific integrase [Propionibacterium freudenreichii]MDK9663033.1 site-specific integrase [Propionibacterium freudenreichii]
MARSWGKIRPLASKRLQASYLAPDGRRYNAPVTFSTRREAGAWLAKQQAAIEEGRWQSPGSVNLAESRRVTVAVAVERWLADLKQAGRAPRTVSNYRSRMNVAILPTMGDRLVKDITREDVEAWYSSYEERTAKHPTAKRSAYMSLRALMSWAVKRQLIEVNPCKIDGAAVHHPSKPVPWGHVLTPEQVRACWQAMPPDNRIAVSLAAWCQLRQGEILGLHIDDFDVTDNLLSITRQVQPLEGVGMKETPPKSDAGTRTIAVPSQVATELLAHMEAWSGDKIVMPRRRNRDDYLHPNTFRRRWDIAAAEAGFPGFVFHDLRHTGLTIYAQQGATAAELLHHGGHSSLEVALRYQHATIERDRDLVKGLEDVIGKE